MANPSDGSTASAPSGSASTKAQRLWDRVESLARKIADEQIAKALGNMRPGGAGAIALGAGGVPSVPILASLLVPTVCPKIPFPLLLDECYIQADIACTMEFDIWVQRPGQFAADAASITGGAPVQLVAARETTLSPIVDAWATRMIEAGSVVSLFVTSSDGLASSVTVTLAGKCV